MPTWHCGSRNCGTHSGADDVCQTGVWSCRRQRPPCGRHRFQGQQCSDPDDAMWSCGALRCRHHGAPDDVCPERYGPWYCNLIAPHCEGHSDRDHRCDADRAHARQCEDPALHGDRPADGSGNAHTQLAPSGSRREREGDGGQTTTIDLRSRACGCPRCNPCAPAFPEGDAPTDIQLESVYIVFEGYWRTRESRHGITCPLEFLDVETPKIITVHCRHANFRWPFAHGFDHYTRHYRFRTNSAHVDVEFFWGDGRIRYPTRWEFYIKLRLTPRQGLSSGDRVKLILQCRPNGDGEWRDLACRSSAFVFRPLAQQRAIARYFGDPQWSIGDVGFFLSPGGSLLTIRMTGQQRTELRNWLDQPLTDYNSLGIVSREYALVAALACLFYLDDQYGAQIAEFFGDPIGFIQRAMQGRVDTARDRILADQRNSVVRTTYGRVLRAIDRPSRQRLIWARRQGAGYVQRVTALMEIAEWITGGARVVVETIRIARFVESILRTDTLYTTSELPFFVTFVIDRVTGAPNGQVAVNLVPDDSFRWGWHVGVSTSANQFLFWESADAYYLPLLNVDRRVREGFRAAAEAQTDGKMECHVCHNSDNLDQRCSVCSQSYHRRCMEWELGRADCPRCLQRDVVDRIES